MVPGRTGQAGRGLGMMGDCPWGTFMVFADFHIGCVFFTATGAWQVTDVGTRVVVAIRLEDCPDGVAHGPPYSVQELVFDEYDFSGCTLDRRG